MTGGESPIGNSLEMYKRVHEEIPEFIEEVERRGLSMKQIYPKPYHNDGKVSPAARARRHGLTRVKLL